MDIFDLSAKITLDTSDYESGISGAQKKTSGFADKLKAGLATTGKVAATGIGAASTAIVALGKIGTEYNTQMETYTTNFEVMLGNQEDAVKKVDELKNLLHLPRLRWTTSHKAHRRCWRLALQTRIQRQH
jgi:hypothetical protein